MKKSLIVFGLGVALASPSGAQSGPVPQKSSEQLVCELTGECGNADDGVEKQAAPDSRGFSISRPTERAKPASAAPTPPVRSATAPQRPQVVNARPRAASTPGNARFSMSKPVPTLGRADLSVSFISGSTVLTEQAKANVDAFVSALSAPSLMGSRFAIEGHTDAVGGRTFNLDLSRRRAQAVSDYIASKGINASRFEVHGYGFDRPRDARRLKSAANRRVEVVKLK